MSLPFYFTLPGSEPLKRLFSCPCGLKVEILTTEDTLPETNQTKNCTNFLEKLRTNLKTHLLVIWNKEFCTEKESYRL